MGLKVLKVSQGNYLECASTVQVSQKKQTVANTKHIDRLWNVQTCVTISRSISWACILVQATIYCKLRVGQDGNIDQSEV